MLFSYGKQQSASPGPCSAQLACQRHHHLFQKGQPKRRPPWKNRKSLSRKKNTYPYVEIHGDYRWLWGRGQFRADSRPMPDKVRRHDERIYLATRRLRLFPFVHFDEQTYCARSSKTCATIKRLTPTITYTSAGSTCSTNRTG